MHEAAIVTILQRVMDIIDPPALPEPPKKDIGFHACPSKPDVSGVGKAEGRSRVKEARGRYRTRIRRSGAKLARERVPP